MKITKKKKFPFLAILGVLVIFLMIAVFNSVGKNKVETAVAAEIREVVPGYEVGNK